MGRTPKKTSGKPLFGAPSGADKETHQQGANPTLAVQSTSQVDPVDTQDSLSQQGEGANPTSLPSHNGQERSHATLPLNNAQSQAQGLSSDQLSQSQEQQPQAGDQSLGQSQSDLRSQDLPNVQGLTMADRESTPIDTPMVDASQSQGQGRSTDPDPVPELIQGSDEEVSMFIVDIRNALDQIEVSDEEALDAHSDLLTLNYDIGKLSTRIRVQYRSVRKTLESAIRQRRAVLQTPVRPPPSEPKKVLPVVQPVQQQTTTPQDKPSDIVSTPVKYLGLTQFLSQMLSRGAIPHLLRGAAKTQFEAFDRPHSVALNNQPSQSYNSQFLGEGIARHTLTKDQINVIQRMVVPTERVQRGVNPRSVLASQMRMPTFNPDFHFPCTVLLVKTNPEIFADFVGPHLHSAVDLNNKIKNKNDQLTLPQMEATFAFAQGVIWICLKLDPKLNSFFNECVGFYLANGTWPQHVTTKPFTHIRCTGVRCSQTLVAEGQYWYFFCSTKELLIKAYDNLLTKVSSVLKHGESAVFLVKPNASLPSAFEYLPTPANYEYLIPVVNMWSYLTINFLSDGYQTKFSPCLFAGGCFLPIMSSPGHAVHGQVVLSMPTFASRLQDPAIDSNSYYSWNTARARWTLVDTNQVKQCDYYERYMANPDQPRVFGSWHFHTCYNREDAMSVARTPNTWSGNVSRGFVPSSPNSSDDAFIYSVMLAHISHQSAERRLTALKALIAKESTYRPEWALRYRQLSTILQPLGPYVSWTPSGTDGSIFDMEFFWQQPYGVYEFAHTMTSATLGFYRGVNKGDYSHLQMIPKQYACNYDERLDQFQQHASVIVSRRAQYGQMPVEQLPPSAKLSQKTTNSSAKRARK